MDRRQKISDAKRARILALKGSGRAITSIAKEFGVSRRSVDFIWYPEKAKINNEKTKARARDGRYYDTKKNTEAVRRCRARKRQQRQQPLSLGDELPKELSRVLKLQAKYAEMPDNKGAVAVNNIQQVLNDAGVAILVGEIAGMLKAYKALKDIR